MRSPYTLDNPPPDEPPSGVLVPSLWRVQARWWKRHTPALDQRSTRRPVCGHCLQAWPCHSWACWDGQLGEAVGMPGKTGKRADAETRPVSDPRMSEAAPLHARARRLAVSGQREKSAA